LPKKKPATVTMQVTGKGVAAKPAPEPEQDTDDEPAL
jgi:hypothetical protein